MNATRMVRNGFLCLVLISLLPGAARAVMPTNPVSDPDFLKMPDGKMLSDVKVSGVRLGLVKGSGGVFGDSAREAYEKLRDATYADPNHKVQWTMMNLDAGQVVAQSLGATRRIFGASVSKVYTGGTLLDKQAGVLSTSQLQLTANMIVVSSNTAWVELQRQIGDGDSNRGRAGVHAFTQRMGYLDTFGFQGTWNGVHGNELTAADLAEYMHDTYKGEYPGAEVLWKLMHTSRTGRTRGKKYIPSDIFVGGKTGTYDGATKIDGKDVNVRVRNHLLLFNIGGQQYGLAILSDTGSDESAALLAGGLLRDFTSYRP